MRVAAGQEEVKSGSRSDTAKLQKGLGLAKALFAFCGETIARALAFTIISNQSFTAVLRSCGRRDVWAKITPKEPNREQRFANGDEASRSEFSSNQDSSNIGPWEASVLWEPSLAWAPFVPWGLLVSWVLWSTYCDASRATHGEFGELGLRALSAQKQWKE